MFNLRIKNYRVYIIKVKKIIKYTDGAQEEIVETNLASHYHAQKSIQAQ